MNALRRATGQTFRSLRVRNYRLYFSAQIISVSGTWMDSVAQAWLVLRLTGSGVDLGSLVAFQFLPLLVAGPWGGLIADRFDKRRLLYATQAAAGLVALALGVLVLTGQAQLWNVYLLALALGCVRVVDNPTRQAFVHEMVGPDHLANAVSLNSVVMNSARIVGPAVAGGLIAGVGLAPCFLINAGSYLAVVTGLALMRPGELRPTSPVARAKGQLRQGLRYVWATPGLRDPLLMMVVVGMLAYEFTVTLSLLAKFSFHGGAGVYGAMLALMSAGAVAGGLFTAHRSRPTTRTLLVSASLFGALILAVAASPVLAVAFVALVPMGAASITFIATANSTLQLRAAPEMRGRVMALYGVAFLGTTPVGGPVVGAVAQATNPRLALVVGGVATLAAAGAFALVGVRRRAAAAVEPAVAAGVDTAVAAGVDTAVAAALDTAALDTAAAAEDPAAVAGPAPVGPVPADRAVS